MKTLIVLLILSQAFTSIQLIKARHELSNVQADVAAVDDMLEEMGDQHGTH